MVKTVIFCKILMVKTAISCSYFGPKKEKFCDILILVHPPEFYFCIFPGFLVFFVLLSSNNNNNNNRELGIVTVTLFFLIGFQIATKFQHFLSGRLRLSDCKC